VGRGVSPVGKIEPLILHELLHTVIASQSTDKAPLWLVARAAVGGVYATRLSASTSTRPSRSIEHRLTDPLNLTEFQQAHRDAAAIVFALGNTYSLTVMRQWLREGIPTQVLEALH
jgi:hypothetical protein